MNKIENTIPRICSVLFPNVRGIIDGGYHRCHKLSNHNLQKLTYSNHKKYNLLKMMDIVMPNGKVFDTYGPFPSDANHNDENLWNHIVEKNEQNMKDVFNPS